MAGEKRPVGRPRKGATAPETLLQGLTREEIAAQQALEISEFMAAPIAVSLRVLGQVVLGHTDHRTAQAQRQAALDVLGGAMWQHLSDAQLDAHLERVIAEVERRRGAKP